jgi:hypothetical protein
LEVNVANEAVTRTIEKSFHVPHEPIQMFKCGGTPDQVVPRPLYHIKEPGALCPEGLEHAPPLSGGFQVQPQKGRGMVRAMRRQGMHIASWEYAFPTIADKCPVDALERLMRMLVAPSVEHAIEVNHLQHDIIEEATELSHQSTIKPIVTLVLSSVNHIKATTQELGAKPSLPD